MHAHRNRKTLLASAAVGAVAIVMSMGDADVARADSACLVGLTTTTCTAPNGTITTTFSGGALVTIINPSAVVYYNGGFISATVTGNIESSTTPLKGVLNFDAITAPTFTYVGTGSLLDSTTTGSTALRINAPSAVINTGSLSVLANGGTGLSVISSGGAGSGGITTVVDGNITVSNGNGLIMTTSNAAADGALNLTINSGNSVTASNGTAVNVNTAGAGNIGVTNNGTIGSTGSPNQLTTGITAQSTGTGSVSVGGTGSIGSALDRAQSDGIDASINNAASTASVSVTPTGPIYATQFGILATNTGTGALTVTSGLVNSSSNIGIYAQETNSAATGNVGVTANGDVTGAGGIFIANSGTGTSTVNTTGNVSASGGSGIGVTAFSSSAGPVNVTTAAGKTIAASSGDGINVSSSGTGNIGITSDSNITSGSAGANTLQNGIFATSSGTAGAISIGGSGSIGTATDRAQGTGVYATITNASSAGNVAVGLTGAGGVYSVARGINATTSGTGNVTIGFNGPVNSSTVEGVYAQSSSGTVTVTAGGATTGATDAINANSISGNVRVDANANVTGLGGTGIYESTQGTKTVNVAAGRSVTGTTSALTFGGAGTATVNNNGTVGALSTGIALNNTSTGAVIFNNNSGATLNGRLTFNSGNDSLTNAGTFNTQGTTDFGAGTDSLVNSGVINLTGASTFSGLEAVTLLGTINQNGNALTLSGGNIFNNGTINTGSGASLLGITAFTNNGTINLGPGTYTVAVAPFTNAGTINATSGASTITGQTSFSNLGLINLQDGAANDTLTIDSNYVGTGGSTLAIDAADAVGDMLVVNGTVSGSTLVDVNLLGTGLFLPGGLLVVDATGSTTNAFSLGGVTGSSPLVDVALVQNGADYYLASTVNATGFAPLLVGLIGPDLWYQSADAYIDQMHLPNDGTGRRMGLWGKIYFGHDKSGGRDGVTVAGTGYNVDNRYKTDRYGVQLGYGFPIGGMGTVGVTGGYGHADTDGVAAGYSAHGWNIGAYGMFGGPVGFHGSALLKYDNYKVDIDGVFDGADGNPDVKSWGVDGEVGYKFGSADTMWWDVFAGLSYVRTKIDDISLGTINYDYDRLHSTRGRLGGRMTFAGDWGLFADATLYHEFSGNSDVTLSDGVNAYRLRTDGHGTWGRLSLGVGGPGSGIAPELSGWVDVGDQQGIGVTAGMRF